jgi:hypothetical protein
MVQQLASTPQGGHSCGCNYHCIVKLASDKGGLEIDEQGGSDTSANVRDFFTTGYDDSNKAEGNILDTFCVSYCCNSNPLCCFSERVVDCSQNAARIIKI